MQKDYDHSTSVTEIPDLVSEKWQSIVDILARMSGFKAALVMRVMPPEIEVLFSSHSQGNPYEKGERAPLDTGLYCETVMASRAELHVPNAWTDKAWNTNPDLKIGMSCYFGIPILWPDGTPFGTICILSSYDQLVTSESHSLIYLFRNVIESDLKSLAEVAQEASQSASARRDIEDRYAAIFWQAAVGIARVGLDGAWLEVNDKLCDIVGYSREELSVLTFQDLTHIDDLDADLGQLNDTIDGKISTYSMEKRYIHKEGHVVWGLLTVSLVRNQDGTPCYFISVIEDITEKKRLRRAVEQSHKLEAMGRLVGGIAHEFNNTLGAISGNLFLASKQTTASNRYVEEAAKLCVQASEMVRQLLTYSRKEQAQKAPLALNPFIREVMERVQVVLPQDIETRVEICEEALFIKANATQVQQIVMNLINNARDAVSTVDRGKVVVRLEDYRATREFQARHPSISSLHFAVLEICDNGSGIVDDDLDKIYDPFFTTKPLGSGLGLGLAIVSSLVEQHGGAVEAESKPNRGTRFRVFLPVLDSVEPQSMVTVSEVVEAGRGETILVVDDNESVLEITGEVLETLGYRVVKARTGEEALGIYKTADPTVDGVLSDVVMPGMGGRELWRQLKEYDAETKLIFMTGYDSQADFETLGCPALRKPVIVYELSRLLRGLLSS